ncbi:hypothetical protein IE81DRAFT_224884 [Ceraceosorus guamensis]|uniref:Uncharacterized protein n=1 Tax=Ceraceosorus guamensis TaxID=1522189 RepID=A0A316WAH6_9BASI|nr:hypothetical protein IE81DRAFT_224884 [Ceraceosorus guamensis]PWN44983.1 hypothetical protein IE81DRAFT_224884 [Ceraceosorus guamensis]
MPQCLPIDSQLIHQLAARGDPRQARADRLCIKKCSICGLGGSSRSSKLARSTHRARLRALSELKIWCLYTHQQALTFTTLITRLSARVSSSSSSS